MARHDAVERPVREGPQPVAVEVEVDVGVGAVGDGQSLISAADTFQPDVIVTDISMPRLNGIEAARLIIQKNPTSRIILLTVYKDSTLLEQGLSAGALGYVLKLKADEELSLAIHSALEDKRFVSSEVS